MNNQQFRRLVLDEGSSEDKNGNDKTDAVAIGSARHGGSNARSVLGTGLRPRANVTTTQRVTDRGSTASELFTRQLKEQKAKQDGTSQGKRRGMAAPRGTKLAAGYVDRAQELRDRKDKDSDEFGSDADAIQRIQALENLVKTGQMDKQTFVQLKQKIIGGEMATAPQNVKGLDRELLARARAGEIDYSKQPEMWTSQAGQETHRDAEDELDDLLDNNVSTVEREKSKKQGVKAEPSAVGKKRARDDILRELREARARTAEEVRASQPALGSHFKKISVTPKAGTSQIVIDEEGREVLIVVDAQGNVKRKTRKQKSGRESQHASKLPMLEKGAKPLGMEVPLDLKSRPAGESESEDIFSDAGTDYNPLGNANEDTGSDVSDQDTEDEEVRQKHVKAASGNTVTSEKHAEPPESNPGKVSQRRNYFAEEAVEEGEQSEEDSNVKMKHSILDAIKRTSSSATNGNDRTSDEALPIERDSEDDRLARIRARIMERDRDEDDIDMGFGSSRFDDQEDEEQRPVKLAKWRDDMIDGNDNGSGRHRERGGQSKRKRAKKGAGNKNDANAVLKVLEARRSG